MTEQFFTQYFSPFNQFPIDLTSLSRIEEKIGRMQEQLDRIEALLAQASPSVDR